MNVIDYNVFYHLDTGVIQNPSAGKPVSDEQVLELAANGIGVLRLKVDKIPDISLKRVNTKTRQIVDCPDKIEQRRVAAIDSKLADLDVKKQRALFEGLRHGDWTWYDKHEEAAAALRAERAGK